MVWRSLHIGNGGQTVIASELSFACDIEEISICFGLALLDHSQNISDILSLDIRIDIQQQHPAFYI